MNRQTKRDVIAVLFEEGRDDLATIVALEFGPADEPLLEELRKDIGRGGRKRSRQRLKRLLERGPEM